MLLFGLQLGVDNAIAGAACNATPLDPAGLAQAAETALIVRNALDEADAPVALVARVGSDLQRYGLVYSHIGFALRDHEAGRWTVLHLLNQCGTDRSGLFAEGLVNFFVDDLVQQDARIVWLEPAAARQLADWLSSPAIHAIHQPRYSVIARPDSSAYQNSTAWVLEALAAARLSPASNRRQAQALLTAQAFKPDAIHIRYSKRIAGSLFAANAAFTDHPVATRLSGNYPVVTVRSILRHLRALHLVSAEREWKDGRLQAVPGPD
jgi:hypothetical protein